MFKRRYYKNKKRNLRIVLLTLGAAVFIIAAVIVMRYYVVGETLYGDWVTCTVEVEGNTLTIEGEPVKESGHVVSDVVITEEEGVIKITTKGALPSPFHKGGFSEKYTAKQDIQQVIVNGHVVWYDGRTISAYTACVYSTRHEYVGDMSANGKTATELGITNVLGNFTNELETEQEPYGWIIKPEKDISEKDKTKKEDYMDSYAYVILAVIGNLDRVTYEYTVEGEKFTRTIDSAMATEYFGRSIKDCGSDMRLLDDLIEMTGLSWN